jgi:hypothetical protein
MAAKNKLIGDTEGKMKAITACTQMGTPEG